ncbi:two-component sensor kinase [Ralstonia pickettii]
MTAASAAFDRTLEALLKAMREGVRLRNKQFAIDLPYLALEILKSETGGSIFYRIVDTGGGTLTGYDDLPMPSGRHPTAYRTVFYESLFRGRQVRRAAVAGARCAVGRNACHLAAGRRNAGAARGAGP